MIVGGGGGGVLNVICHFECFKHSISESRYIHMCGPGSIVGIATAYGLDGPGIESR